MKTSFAIIFFATTAIGLAEPVDIGNRLELFIDDHLIAGMDGDASQQLLRPEPKEVVLVADAPWEGNTSGYFGVFRDGDLYRMVYRGWQHDENKRAAHPEVTCYAESTDGVNWTKPEIGLFEWEGSKKNNIIWLGPGCHNFTAFLDTNPDAPADARFKALGGSGGKGGLSHGLLPFASPDCKAWRIFHKDSVITNGAFDSQNLAFWDPHREEYRAYWRYFTKDSRVRAIRTATSKDFINWENEADLTYSEGTPEQHLYTNAIQKYFRAPHLFIGFPTRYLPNEGQRVEPILMTSRDGVLFHRWNEAVIPEEAPADRKGNRSNYMTWGMFQLPDKPREISVYATENYYEPTPGRVRRFVYRVDGFVALRGGAKGGNVTTKPLKYSGEKLLLNHLVRESGSILIEALNESGQVIGRSEPIEGDAIDAPVKWATDPKLNAGVLRLRFSLKNADVFSIRFQ